MYVINFFILNNLELSINQYIVYNSNNKKKIGIRVYKNYKNVWISKHGIFVYKYLMIVVIAYINSKEI